MVNFDPFACGKSIENKLNHLFYLICFINSIFREIEIWSTVGYD